MTESCYSYDKLEIFSESGVFNSFVSSSKSLSELSSSVILVKFTAKSKSSLLKFAISLSLFRSFLYAERQTSQLQIES